MPKSRASALETKYCALDSVKLLRVKTLYEKMVREKVGHPVYFSIDPRYKSGNEHIGRFLMIYEKCQRLGVNVETYLTVLFTYPPPFVARWPYPYLQYIASNKAEEIFLEKNAFIKRVFNGKEDDIIRAASPLNVEARFTNCFYNGFPILLSTYRSIGMENLRKLELLFPLFYSFPEVFTVEFLVSHNQYSFYKDTPLVEQEDIAVQVAIYDATKVLWKRYSEEQRYHAVLDAARKAVREREFPNVRTIYFHGESEEVLGEIWNLM